MTRSSWKASLSRRLNTPLTLRVSKAESKPKRVYSRSDTILPQHLNLEFLVYNGSQHRKVRVLADMVGSKFGEWSLTRQNVIHKVQKPKKTRKLATR